MTSVRNCSIALGLVGALGIGLSATASAGPMPIRTIRVESISIDPVIDVGWRGGGRNFGPGVGVGIAAGALLGAAVSSQAYGPGYYYGEPGYGPGYGQPAYAPAYGYEPAYPAQPYYAPEYRYGQCTTDEGYGRRHSCSAQ